MTERKCSSPRCQNLAGRGKRGMCNKHSAAWLAVNRPVDAEIVRAHIDRLRESGLGMRRIARLSDTGKTTIWDILHGGNHTTFAPTARAILAVQPGHTDRFARVPIVGAGRRIRGLIAVGWSEPEIAMAAVIADSTLWRCVHERATELLSETHDRIDAAFQTLSVQPPPEGWVAERARRRAARRGWPPALAWDVETIDDPDARPVIDAIRPPKPAAVLEDFRVEYLELRDELRLSDAAIAERLGITSDLLGSRLSRLKIPMQQSRAAS